VTWTRLVCMDGSLEVCGRKTFEAETTSKEQQQKGQQEYIPIMLLAIFNETKKNCNLGN